MTKEATKVVAGARPSASAEVTAPALLARDLVGLAEAFTAPAPDRPTGRPVPAAPPTRRARPTAPSNRPLLAAVMEAHPRLLTATRLLPVGAASTSGISLAGTKTSPRVRAESPCGTRIATYANAVATSPVSPPTISPIHRPDQGLGG